MPTITLSEPWTYRTPLRTIHFPAGDHTVDDDIFKAAPAGVTKDEDDGDAEEAGKGATTDASESEQRLDGGSSGDTDIPADDAG